MEGGALNKSELPLHTCSCSETGWMDLVSRWNTHYTQPLVHLNLDAMVFS